MTTIDHTCIHVLDLDRSAAFYRNALGLTPVRSLDMPDRGWQLLFLGDGTTDFQLELCRETNRTEPYHLGDDTPHLALRALGEKLGFIVTWADGEAKLEKKDIYTVVRPGDDVYFITTNHKDMVGMSAPISFGAVPYISNGTTYVSLDFFKTLMDYQNGSITLDGSTIQIDTGK